MSRRLLFTTSSSPPPFSRSCSVSPVTPRRGGEPRQYDAKLDAIATNCDAAGTAREGGRHRRQPGPDGGEERFMPHPRRAREHGEGDQGAAADRDGLLPLTSAARRSSSSSLLLRQPGKTNYGRQDTWAGLLRHRKHAVSRSTTRTNGESTRQIMSVKVSTTARRFPQSGRHRRRRRRSAQRRLGEYKTREI